MILYIEIDDKNGYSASLKTCSRINVCWTHWFAGTYTTQNLYIREASIIHDINFGVIYRWKL